MSQVATAGERLVALADEAGQTRLRYTARAQVGGKMAQIGSRLVDAAAAKISEDFFQAFETRLREEAGVPAEAAVAAPVPAPAGIGRYGWWIGAGALILLALWWALRR